MYSFFHPCFANWTKYSELRLHGNGETDLHVIKKTWTPKFKDVGRPWKQDQGQVTNAWLIYTQVNRTVYKDKKVTVKSDYTFCMGVTLGNLTVYKLEAQPTEPVSLTWQQNDTEANFKGR